MKLTVYNFKMLHQKIQGGEMIFKRGRWRC